MLPDFCATALCPHQQGIALVITLILLAVITFTAITFLVLARREKGAVVTSTEQAIARLAADTGSERANAEILSTIFAQTNKFAYGLKASTAYYNPFGFVSGGTDLTNVNYRYADGTALNTADQIQNIANLYYSPNPPVYIVTNTNPRSGPQTDFRHYLDLNQNRRFEPNGRQPVVGPGGYYMGTNGQETTYLYNPNRTAPGDELILSNSMVGDPEWIGILERPDERHSPSNRFTARYATIVVPEGKTIDANRAHNQAFTSYRDYRDFRRNMGVGTWEMNLGSFLVDLNTNLWPGVDFNSGNDYIYDPLAQLPRIQGRAFEDANNLIRYRYDTDWNRLRGVDVLFGLQGRNAFLRDMIDGTGAGPFLTNVFLVELDDPDTLPGGDLANWSGDDNPKHFFAPGDFFDPAKTARFATPQDIAQSNTFPQRLQIAGDGVSTYDRYTFYRLLSQLGTDGGYERDKVNINYDNRVARNANSGAVSATNFFEWQPVDFFVEAGNALLADYLESLPGRQREVYSNLSMYNIPVVINGEYFYRPSINRLLQLAANIYDSTTNRVDGTLTNHPTVFRPLFRVEGASNDLYIAGWQEVNGINGDAWRRLPPKDPLNAAERAEIAQQPDGVNVFGVPWVIGAKKGLPNFNELTVENIFEVTRKLALSKPNVDAFPNATNQMLLLSARSHMGVEAWNSYLADFDRPVDVYATNILDLYIKMVNQPTAVFGNITNVQGYRMFGTNAVGVLSWTGSGVNPIPVGQSFMVPVYTNFVAVTNLIFRADGRVDYLPLKSTISAFDRSSTSVNRYPIPDIQLAFTNRLQFAIVDRETRRILDYVQIRAGSETNLMQVIADPMANRGWNAMWVTNRLGGNEFEPSAPPLGVINQLEASQGFYGQNNASWRDVGGFNVGPGQTVAKEIDKFMSFMTGNPMSYPPYGRSQDLIVQAPFTPTRRISHKMSWQANDPLVHYTAGDLEYRAMADSLTRITIASEPQVLDNIGRLNDRYEPWGGNPDSTAQTGTSGARRYDLRLKDPGVMRSDRWTFPTNKYPNVGWLGRVHRGTPWQTVYLKATDIEIGQRRRPSPAEQQWMEWTGNSRVGDARLTVPQTDRRLFDLFTAGFNDNATAGQMSVNQDGLAAWSAVLGGVIVLTNTTPDESLLNYDPRVGITNEPILIEPAGVDTTNSALARIVRSINQARNEFPGRSFQYAGDVLKAGELTQGSPFLNTADVQRRLGITDPVYERIPQQIMGLLRGNENPRYVIYSYGQTLKPAPNSLVQSGNSVGLCTNYQITAEVATRAVVRVVGSFDEEDAEHENPEMRYPPRVVVESYNVLPPE